MLPEKSAPNLTASQSLNSGAAVLKSYAGDGERDSNMEPQFDNGENGRSLTCLAFLVFFQACRTGESHKGWFMARVMVI